MSTALATSTPDTLDKLAAFQEKMLAAPQIRIRTEHVIHAGIYTRTIRLEPGTVLMGALIKVPTTLVVCGNTAVFVGDGWIQLNGYHVIPAKAGRKQVFVTHGETAITMSFRTDARTVEQAEAEFTDEAGLLVSRKDGSEDSVVITED